jgi:uncharacterized membrane protein
MMQLFNEMYQALFEANKLHAMLVHFPIAISIVGLIMLVIFSFTGGTNNGWRWACVLIYCIGMSTAFLAAQAGGSAMHNAAGHVTSDAVTARMHEHAQMGSKVWMFLAVTTTLITLTAIPYNGPRIGFLVLSVVSALATVGWIGVTAHHGGTLVYAHAVGVEREEEKAAGPKLIEAPTPTPTPTSKPKSKHARTPVDPAEVPAQ